MAGIKISDLPAVVAPALTDIYPIDQGTVTYKVTNSQILSLLQTNATGTWSINISGNAATATLATTVTTNANLTGAVTSVGNATSYATNVPLNRGGLNAALTASNGGIFYSTATAGAILSGTSTANQVLLSGASTTPIWSTATYPTTAGALGNVLTSDGTNWISSAATGGNPLTTKGDLFTFTTVDARLPIAVGDGKVLQVSSGATTGLVWSTPTYPSASGTVGKVIRSDGTNNVYSTTTFADTYTVSSLLYASSANAVAALATANNGILVTSSVGVPSVLAGSGVTGNYLQSNAAAAPSWSAFTLILGGNLTTIGAFNSIFRMTSATDVTFPTSGTLATTSQIPSVTPSALTRTDDTNVTVTLGGTPATALLQAVSLTMGWTGQLSLARGGSNANLTASNGGIVWSNATQMQILAGTATARQMLQSGSTAAPTWSTTTWPATSTAGRLLYSTFNNVVGELTTTAASVLTSSAGSVPTWVAGGTTGNVLTFNGTIWTSAAPTGGGGGLEQVMLLMGG